MAGTPEPGGPPLGLRKGPDLPTLRPKNIMACRMDFAILASLAHRRTPVKDAVRSLPRGMSVKDDWRAWLPQEKSQVFHKQVHELECSYAMLSVSLDEAIELRQLGHTGKSCQAVSITSGLCKLLTRELTGLLRALAEHAKHYGTIPNAAPLDAANFQGARAQRSARMSTLLNHVLFSQRLQFLHKVSTLEEMVEDLAKGFRHAADDLAVRNSSHPNWWMRRYWTVGTNPTKRSQSADLSTVHQTCD